VAVDELGFIENGKTDGAFDLEVFRWLLGEDAVEAIMELRISSRSLWSW
jgi:hypothetical protein